MKTVLFMAAAILMAGSTPAADPVTIPAVPPKIVAFAERPSAVYKTGEEIRFKIWLIQPGSISVKDPVNPDSEKPLEGMEIKWELT